MFINKRGQFDLIEISITVLSIAMLIILVLYVNSKVTDVYKNIIGSENENSTAYQAVDKANITFQSGLDNLFLGIFVLLLIGMIILAFYIESSVLFLVLFIVVTIISVWFAAIISNVYQTVEATGIFASVLVYLPMQSFIMEWLPVFIAGFAMILLIITYSKNVLFQRVGIDGGQ
jgi:hypothetical protein